MRNFFELLDTNDLAFIVVCGSLLLIFLFVLILERKKKL